MNSVEIEILNTIKNLLKKYQVPFGIAIWGFTEQGKAKEIKVDDQGRLVTTSEITNLPSWITSSTKTTDDLINELSTIVDRLYDSVEAKSLTTIVKEIRDKSQWARLDNLDIPLSSIDSTLKSVLSRYARLQIFDSASGSWKNVVDYLPIAIQLDNVGLATEATLNVIRTIIDSFLPNIDVPVSTVAKIRVYEQSFENGVSDLTAYNCSQAVQSAEVFAGSYALQVTIPAGQTGYVETPTRPVSPNQRVTFSFAHKEDGNISGVKLVVVWYRANMHEISREEYALTPSASWQLDSRTVVAPQNATYMALRIQATASSSGDGVIYIDDIHIELVGQVFKVDGAGNLMAVIENFPSWFTSSTKTIDEVYAKIEALTNALSSIGSDKLLVIPDNPPNLDTPLSIIANRLYDSTEAKSITQIIKEIRDKTQWSRLDNLDISLSTINDSIKGVQPRYARLQIYDSATGSWKDVVDSLPITGSVSVNNFPSDYPDSGAHSRLDTIHSDLQSINTNVSGIKSKTDKLRFDTNNNLYINIGADSVGLLKEGGTVNVGNFPSDYPDSGTHSRLDALKGALASVGSDKFLTKPDNPPNLDIPLSTIDSTLKSELTRIVKLMGYDYASAVWRNIAVDDSGRLLCTLQ